MGGSKYSRRKLIRMSTACLYRCETEPVSKKMSARLEPDEVSPVKHMGDAAQPEHHAYGIVR